MSLHHPTRRTLLLATGAALLARPALALPADTSRALRIVLPLAAGGSSDVVARAMARRMEQSLGRPVIVENRTGGQGAVGSAAVVGAPPDGLTLLMAASSIVQNPSLFKDVPNHLPQLKPVSQVIASPNALAVSPKLEVRSLGEFVKLAQARPGTLSVATVSTLGQAMCAMLKSAANIDFTVAPYRGESQAIPDVLGGHVSAVIGSPGSLQQQGLRVLAVGTQRRSQSTPDVPTFTEAGYPRINVSGWLGMFAHAQTSAADIQTLEQAVMTAVQAPEVLEKIRAVGMEPAGTTTTAFQDLVARELEFWAVAAKDVKPAS